MTEQGMGTLENEFRERGVLITGGAGFIGSHLAERLHKMARVRVLDNTAESFPENLRGLEVEVVRGSVTDETVVQESMKSVDYVFHLAAMVSAAESVAQPMECNRVNVQGLLNVLKAAGEAGVKKLIFSSSAAVYGNNPLVPKRESMTPEPVSPYAITKLDGEYYCQFFTRELGLQTASLRYFNVFGPRQNPNSTYAAAVPFFLQQALQNEPIYIYGDGEQTRDFIHVDDVVSANLFAASCPDANGVFNVGCGEQITINELAKAIVRLTGSRSEITYASARPGDVKHSRADTRKLKGLGFTPQRSLQEGLESLVSRYRGRQESASTASTSASPKSGNTDRT